MSFKDFKEGFNKGFQEGNFKRQMFYSKLKEAINDKVKRIFKKNY